MCPQEMRISTVCLLAFLTLLAQLEVVVVTDHAVTFFTMGDVVSIAVELGQNLIATFSWASRPRREANAL